MTGSMFTKTAVRWIKSPKKLFLLVFCCTVTILLLEYLSTSKILHWFSSSLPRMFHKAMTMEDVMTSLRWDFPMVSHWTSVQNTSRAQHSTVTLEHPQTQYCVGENLDVRVEMRDHNGRLKRQGGDFLLGRIHSHQLQASASRLVTDHRNGSYSIRFTLFWPGEVQVSVLLMHSSEAVQTLWRNRQLNYKKIKHTGTFTNGSKVETSECGFQLSADQPLCEYRDERDGEFYACYQPPSLPCHSIHTMFSANTAGSVLTEEEKQLLTWNQIGTAVKNNFSSVHVINCTANPYKPTQKCILGMKSRFPSGHFFQNRWFSSYCTTGSFFDAESVNSCLKGKRFFFSGDSTVRQWMKYLIKFQKDHKNLETAEVIPILFVNSELNYTTQWKHHNYPWITARQVRMKEAHYISRDLDRLEVQGEDELVVVISVGQHFRAFPLELFVRRLLSLRKAIQRLQARISEAQVFIKLENTRELYSEQERFSDWHGHVQNLAQREVFGDLSVGFIDAWDMTVAANSFSIHPDENIIANEVALFLSFLCQTP